MAHLIIENTVNALAVIAVGGAVIGMIVAIVCITIDLINNRRK